VIIVQLPRVESWLPHCTSVHVGSPRTDHVTQLTCSSLHVHFTGLCIQLQSAQLTPVNTLVISGTQV